MKQNIDLFTYFAQQVLNAAAAGCDQMHPGTHKKAKQLCGRQFWEELSRLEQIQAGHIISAAVRARKLPLIRGERCPCNHRRYERT